MTEATRAEGHRPQSGRIWIRICLLMVSSHTAAQGSGLGVMGRRTRLPTKVFCLTVNQNIHEARSPSSCQSWKWASLVSALVISRLNCSVLNIHNPCTGQAPDSLVLVSGGDEGGSLKRVGHLVPH